MDPAKQALASKARKPILAAFLKRASLPREHPRYPGIADLYPAANRMQRAAFDLTGEPKGIIESYGPNLWGSSVLIARRLIEAGSAEEFFAAPRTPEARKFIAGELLV